MKNVEISRQYFLSYRTLYGEAELNLEQSLRLLPLKPALELISVDLHNHNVRKRPDTRFQSTQLFSWMMQMDKNEQLLIIDFSQKENILISDYLFQFLDRKLVFTYSSIYWFTESEWV